MKIIISDHKYPEKRNIITDGDNTYLNFRYKNLWLYINALKRKIFKKNKSFIFQTIPTLIPEDIAVIHLFNEVARTNRKWVSTFETEIPRVLPVKGMAKLANPELHSQLKLAAAAQCIGVIAISEATRNIQLKLLHSFPAEKQVISAKLHVLHPPQSLLHEEVRHHCEPKVTFTFIGSDFYRKGGAEVVLAFSELADEGVIDVNTVQVNVIGDLTRRHNIAHGRFQDDEPFYTRIETLLGELPVFKQVNSLPNTQFLQLLKETQVGLLPTWQDTYGFSVLEMQASGCPVITTNVRALPEINPEQAGWLIACPLNDRFELTVSSEQEKNQLRKLIVTKLKEQVTAILQDRSMLHARSAGSLARIRLEHDPAAFRARLNEIYQSAI
ncbi:glycosyltransferase [Erwinia amylovora]|uniref:glycosyltransferase n=1 Tax=Erwinia amylovora TaxID=552 RepID=UPI001444888F|nr:glycosyltransferase [Erwinia amylovora]